MKKYIACVAVLALLIGADVARATTTSTQRWRVTDGDPMAAMIAVENNLERAKALSLVDCRLTSGNFRYGWKFVKCHLYLRASDGAMLPSNMVLTTIGRTLYKVTIITPGFTSFGYIQMFEGSRLDGTGLFIG